MRVLITGGNGLVGYAVKKTKPGFISDCLFPSRETADLRDFGSCKKLFEWYRPTHVIHLAARVGGVKANTNFIGEFFTDNILINTNVLESCRLTKVDKVVSLLSTCIYPDKINYPIQAEKLHDGEPHSSNFGYAYAKRMIEVQSRAYNQQYGTNFLCLVPNNIYGPNDNFDLENGHVIPALIRKIHEASISKSIVHLWGDGSNLRQFTYSFDIANGIWWALLNYDGSLLNIGTDEEVSIKTAVEKICDCMSVSAKNIVWDTNQPSGQHRKPSDISKFRELSQLKQLPFIDGIKQTVQWFWDNRT